MVFFLVATFIGIIVYRLFYIYTKDALNPFGISAFELLFSIGFTALYLNPYMPQISYKTYLIVLIATAEIIFVGFITLYPTRNVLPFQQEESQPEVRQIYTVLMWLIVIISGLCVVYLLVKSGFDINTYSNNESFDKKSDITIGGSRSIIDYLAHIFPYTPIFATYQLLFGKKNGFVQKILCYTLIVVVALYDWFVLISRGTLLVMILGIAYLINQKKKLSIRIVLIGAAIVVVAFGALMLVRVNSKSGVYAGSMNPVINSGYNYLAFCYVNLDKLVQYGAPYTIITKTWISLSKVLGIYDASQIYEVQTLMYNARSFFYDFYHDFGVAGILIYPPLIYAILGRIYVRSRTDKPQYSLYIAMLMKAICIVSYGNYFFGVIANDMIYFATIFILLISYYKVEIRFVFKK